MKGTIQLLLGDITAIEADVVVNAANERLVRGGGVCGAIFRGAGRGLDAACRKIGHCATGDAVLTPGFHLPAAYIIHTVGPVWQGGEKNEAALLASCYDNSLSLAYEHGLRRIAFPSISTGIFGYPTEAAAKIAIDRALCFCKDHAVEVMWVLFDERTKAAYDAALAEAEDEWRQTK
ncbi:MAG: macro domain-containing protein [Peptoniphilus sp.]|nr:macro domain-containing protein [Peptoniphilus sp.]MDY3118058.1 macro domain-containing protein [Peptoniphilus sp.]